MSVTPDILYFCKTTNIGTIFHDFNVNTVIERACASVIERCAPEKSSTLQTRIKRIGAFVSDPAYIRQRSVSSSPAEILKLNTLSATIDLIIKIIYLLV